MVVVSLEEFIMVLLIGVVLVFVVLEIVYGVGKYGVVFV